MIHNFNSHGFKHMNVVCIQHSLAISQLNKAVKGRVFLKVWICFIWFQVLFLFCAGWVGMHARNYLYLFKISFNVIRIKFKFCACLPNIKCYFRWVNSVDLMLFFYHNVLPKVQDYVAAHPLSSLHQQATHWIVLITDGPGPKGL